MTRDKHTKAVRIAVPKRLILSVKHRRLNGRGFGCYFAGSARRGKSEIVIDCDAIAFVAAMHGTHEFKRTFIESLAHEFMHALEDTFGVMFNEKKVEAAIRRGAKALGYGDEEGVQAPQAATVQAGRADSSPRRRRSNGSTPAKATRRNAHRDQKAQGAR